MICRLDLRFALIALTLAGCLGASDRPASDTTPQSGPPAFVRLLSEADAAMADGALNDAGRKLDDARALQPENPDLWVAIARLRYRGGEHISALEAIGRALALRPDHASALLMRALIVRDAHGFAPALPWFAAALAADPHSADAWAEYAATLGDDGRGRTMLLTVRKLSEIAPQDPRVFFLQAVLAARGDEHALARSLLVRSGMTARGVPAAILLDALLSFEEGNSDSAATTLAILVERQPANARVRELLARALLLSGREAELIEQFGADAAQSETSPYLMMLVARAYERLGDRASAAPLLARAYAGAGAAPVALTARYGLPQPTAEVRRAALAGNWRAAQANAQSLRARFPTSADIAILTGDAVLGGGDAHDALSAYALAAKVRRPWPLTRKAVFAYRSSGDELAADILLARHVLGEPNAVSGLFTLAQQQARRGEWMRVALLLDHAISLGGGHDPALLALRIKAARALEKTVDARGFAMLLANIRPRALSRQ